MRLAKRRRQTGRANGRMKCARRSSPCCSAAPASRSPPPPAEAVTRQSGRSSRRRASRASTSPAMDKSVKPGDDFFLYANGSWFKNTEIPADRSSIGASFITQQELEKRMDALMADLAKSNAAAGSNERKLADYRAAFMDQAGIDQRTPARAQGRHRPLHGDRRQAGAGVGDRRHHPRRRRSAECDRPPDRKSVRHLRHPVDVRPAEERPLSAPGRIGLPDRDYYLSSDPEMAKIRDAYRPFIAKMLASAGSTTPRRGPSGSMTSKRKIAAAHATIVETEDSFKANNPWSQADFAKKAPGIDWNAFFQGAQLSTVPTIVVWHPEPTRKLAALVASEPLDAWKDWLASTRSSSRGRCFRAQMHKDDFAFFGTTLDRHAAGAAARQAACSRICNWLMGDAVGQLYVAKYFPASEKADIDKMVDGIKAAFDKRIEALTGWRRRPRRKPAPRSPRCTSASAIPTSGATIRRSRSGRTTPTATTIARRAVRISPPARQARPGARQQRMVDGPADRQRGQHAAAECA